MVVREPELVKENHIGLKYSCNKIKVIIIKVIILIIIIIIIIKLPIL
jgi:hypothetical protein